MVPLHIISNSCFARICEFVMQIYNLFFLRFALFSSLSSPLFYRLSFISIHSCRCNNICHTHHSLQVQDIRFRRHTFRRGFYECILAHRYNPHQHTGLKYLNISMKFGVWVIVLALNISPSNNSSKIVDFFVVKNSCKMYVFSIENV